LDPLTRLLAKPAVPVAGVPLGARVLQWLAHEGITDAVLNLHHLPHTVTGAIGDGAALGLRVRYSWEPTVLGSAGGPRHALPLLFQEPINELADATQRRPLLIVNGDTLTEAALAPLIEDHRAHGADVTLLVVPNSAPDRYNGIAATDGVVTHFIPKGHTESSWHFVGVQVVNANVFASLPDNAPAETVSGIYRQLLATRPGALRIFRADATFHDVGTPADYRHMCEAFSGTDAHGNVVWPGSRIDPGAQLEDCVVACVTHVPAGLAARSSVLVPKDLMRSDDRCRVVGNIAIFERSSLHLSANG
jgi:mannose-1-phosphate guanylyltransferase